MTSVPIVLLKSFECKGCGYSEKNRTNEKVMVCPKCKGELWDIWEYEKVRSQKGGD